MKTKPIVFEVATVKINMLHKKPGPRRLGLFFIPYRIYRAETSSVQGATLP